MPEPLHVVFGTGPAGRAVASELYMYGPTGGAPMTEATPVHPTSTKCQVRAHMSAELLEAHRHGRVQVAIGRAADFIGPGVTTLESYQGAHAAASKEMP